MLLKSFQISDYRSVHDSGEVEVEDAKTLLVGVNEAGKTAVLRALQQINAPSDTEGFSALRDYPRSRYTEVQRGERSPDDVVVARATFRLTDADKALVIEHSPLSTDVEVLTVFRYLDNSLKWNFGHARLFAVQDDIEKDLARLRAHLANRTDTGEVVAALDALNTGRSATAPLNGVFATKLTAWLAEAYPLIDEDDEKEEQRFDRIKGHVTLAVSVAAAGKAVRARIPLFVYYSTYFTVRPRINLAALAAREAAGDIDVEYDFGNLCLLRLLGHTAAELSELAAGEPRPENYRGGAGSAEYQTAMTDRQAALDDRQYRLNAASVDLTRSIREVWGDESVQLRLVVDGQYLKVVVVDDIGVEVELDQRSEGFRWLVSFFVVFKAQARDNLANAILLLDEPGLSLHALKQQEFRKTVSRLAEDNQVVYSTHSPFMVGTDELDLVRIVEMTDRTTGTRVHTRMVVDDPRSIYPLQIALGYELAQSLFGQSRNLICEGLTDMMYVEALNIAFTDAGKGLRTGVSIVPASGASKVAYYATILVSQNLKVAALLDSDQAGNRAAAQDDLVQLLTSKKILRTKDYCSPTVSHPEIEDLLRETLVRVARDDMGWDVTATATAQPHRPIIDILTKEVSGFSKFKLVRGFIRWIGSHEVTDLTADEQAGVAKLLAAINKALV
ncbi:OLD family endonuclease [Serinibacter arcticus]|uniref:OLD family endonuclease n=1 Tax=Serinibacter arcticus TaxID=1655435 RepID=A0A2U1ZWH3_9MICO|nr:AAA family ATPase [Serinibacter arcticus]PWD51321.1 OLD family endonuclease [Serinibacter arcticus]